MNAFPFAPLPRRVLGRFMMLLLAFSGALGRAQTWQDHDIGAVGLAGSSSESDGVITLRGSGADIWHTADGFHFRATTQAGDGAVVVRITSTGGGHAWAKVGLMMREDLTPGAKAVLAYATPGNHAGLQARAATGGHTVVVADTGTTLPVWLLLDRVGDLYQAYKSYDGDSWTRIGQSTVVMTETVYVGLAISSHNNGALQVGTVDNFMQLAVGKLPEPTNLRITGKTGYAFELAWDANGSPEAAFEIERANGSDAPFVRVATTQPGAIFHTDTGTGVVPNSIYRYRVRATDGQAVSIYSNIVMGQSSNDPYVAAPSNLHATFASASALQLQWTDNSNDETQFELSRRQQGAPDYAIIAMLPANTTTYNDSGLTANAAYDYRVRASRNGIYSAYATVGAGTTLADAGNWAGGDIGAVGSAGATSVSSDGSTFTLRAGGGDIWGTADAFRIHYRQWSGDGTIIARVASLTQTDPWAKAGVMVRATFDSTSPNVAMVLSAGNVSGFQIRGTPGAATTFLSGPRVNPAYWVRLTRVGDVFAGSVSADGTTWSDVGSTTVAMGSQVFIGLVASAHSDTGAQTTAVFDEISLPGSPTPPPPDGSWTRQAWGGTTGSFTHAGADVRVTAQGGDIWGTSDSGLFVCREWTGDVTLITRFDHFSPSNDWTKAGLMIRASGAANAANAFVAITHWHGQVFQSRVATGGQTTSPQQNNWNEPFQWLKLVRVGNTFSGYESLDNQATWTLLGTQTIDMPATALVGLAVSSHTNASPTTAGFASVSVE